MTLQTVGRHWIVVRPTIVMLCCWQGTYCELKVEISIREKMDAWTFLIRTPEMVEAGILALLQGAYGPDIDKRSIQLHDAKS